MEPIYAENIIVGVVYEKIFSWYVTSKEIWFLDYNIWSEAFDVCDENSNYDDCIERKGIPVVNCTTAKQFLNNLSDYQITANELRKKIQDKRAKQEDLEDYLDFSPSLYVDFDKKKLYSLFPEPASFEDYVPTGWDGVYADFTKYIPENEKYWIDENHCNLLLK